MCLYYRFVVQHLVASCSDIVAMQLLQCHVQLFWSIKAFARAYVPIYIVMFSGNFNFIGLRALREFPWVALTICSVVISSTCCHLWRRLSEDPKKYIVTGCRIVVHHSYKGSCRSKQASQIICILPYFYLPERKLGNLHFLQVASCLDILHDSEERAEANIKVAENWADRICNGLHKKDF